MRFKILLIISFMILLPVVSWGACTGSSPTWNSTPDYASVNSCLSQARVGDTIYVSAGVATWNSTLSVTKGVNLIGAGVGNTTIQCGNVNPLMKYLPSNQALNAQWEVSGFSLDSNNTCIVLALGESNFPPTTFQTNVKIHHNEFYGTTSINSDFQYVLNYGMGGVIYDNTFTGADQQIRSVGYGYTDLYDLVSNSWGGHVNALYIEDNVFNYDSTDDNYIADCQFAVTRRVWRYNTFNVNSAVGGSGLIDYHGYDYTELTSCYGDFIYGNQLISSSNESVVWGTARGGKSLIFYNNATTSGSVNAGQFYAYPYGCPPDYYDHQCIQAYNWNNRKNLTTDVEDMVGNPPGGFTDCCGQSEYPVEDKSVFNFEPSFDGSSGVGCGSELPNGGDASGYLEGAGFWVTSQSCSDLAGFVGPHPATPVSGSLYKVVDGSWVKIYTPYTYPHPLRSPQPPTGFMFK